ncbi:hypothetical protein E1B28_000013 [Marasmius oreades]|uniref:Cytochrome b5 heme-binding domain-containing protein n=1 Tax=Marasmius oreades TaxID=181124 RepID=A0A9P8ADW9_9AGAR|nr:uncharacterized protein E1B28_000013 [Marasmius oreades]KAG7098037.1 hypothetical protein E1B28_000013 [Marasmius oreades]
MFTFCHDDDSQRRLAFSASLIAVLPVIYLVYRKVFATNQGPSRNSPAGSSNSTAASLAAQGQAPNAQKRETKSIMQPAKTDLAPPKDDPFTLEQLKEFNGSDPTKPIYVSIKGTVFDVSHKNDVYGAGKSYNVFAGTDGSRGLGMSSLKLEDAVPDYSVLDEKDMKTLNDWHDFFKKRYNIVGRVTDLPLTVVPPNL